MAHLTTYLDIESCKILRSGFDFTSNLTSAIGNLANHGFLASYVSRHMAMAYDILSVQNFYHALGSTACANWLLSKTGIFSECPGNPRFELWINNVPHG